MIRNKENTTIIHAVNDMELMRKHADQYMYEGFI